MTTTLHPDAEFKASEVSALTEFAICMLKEVGVSLEQYAKMPEEWQKLFVSKCIDTIIEAKNAQVKDAPYKCKLCPARFKISDKRNAHQKDCEKQRKEDGL